MKGVFIDVFLKGPSAFEEAGRSETTFGKLRTSWCSRRANLVHRSVELADAIASLSTSALHSIQQGNQVIYTLRPCSHLNAMPETPLFTKIAGAIQACRCCTPIENVFRSTPLVATSVRSPATQHSKFRGPRDPKLVVLLAVREPELFELRSPPTRLDEATNSVLAGPDRLKMFKGAELALLELSTQERFSDTQVAVASSTSRLEWALTCLGLLQVGTRECSSWWCWCSRMHPVLQISERG